LSTKDLYRFVEGTVINTFTSSNEAEVYTSPIATGPETYVSKIMGRGEISDKAQPTKGSLDITFPLNDDFAQHLLNSGIDSVVRVDIYSKDEAGVFRTEWRGRLSKTAPKDKEITVTFESVFSANRRVGSRRVFQRTCPYAVYGPGCTLSLAAFLTAATVTAMSADGRTLTVPEAAAKPNGFYLAGVIQMPDGSMRYISGHVGSTLVMIRSSDSLNAAFAAASPVDVNIAKGCTQLQITCGDSDFNNLLDFGGFPYMPFTNPIAGSSIV
jgi:hypothetical protein